HQHRHRLRHRHHDEDERLVRVLDQDLRREPLRVIDVVDAIDDDEEADGEEQPDVLPEFDGEVAHFGECSAAAPRLSELATMLVSVISSPSSSRMTLPS